jgi:hypothetical protein
MKHKLLLIAALALTSCAGVTKTNQLSPGMHPAEVRASFGAPSQTQFIGNKWVWKYYLHQPWKGFVPYHLVFNRNTQVLEEWYADEAEYVQQQQLWMQALPQPVQRHAVDVYVR